MQRGPGLRAGSHLLWKGTEVTRRARILVAGSLTNQLVSGSSLFASIPREAISTAVAGCLINRPVLGRPPNPPLASPFLKHSLHLCHPRHCLSALLVPLHVGKYPHISPSGRRHVAGKRQVPLDLSMCHPFFVLRRRIRLSVVRVLPVLPGSRWATPPLLKKWRMFLCLAER